MAKIKTTVLLVILLGATSLQAQEADESYYSSQYNKIYKAYVREPNDVSNLLAMAMFYADTANPMQDFPMAMHFATEAESLYVAIIEDRDRYKEAKKLIKKNITVTLVRQTKQHVISRARRELASDEPISEALLNKYAEAFSNDPNTIRLIEGRRLQTRYLQTQKTNTLAAYRSFIENYGTTQEGEDATTEMNHLAASLVSDAKSEEEVDRILQGFLDMEPVRSAAISKKSAIAYAAVMENPSPKAYRDYLKKYPGSDGYSTVLNKMEDLLNLEFEKLHSARQYADFAIENPDNPLADEAISRLKKLITEKRDMEALKIYLAEFPLDVNYNDIYLQVFNWHTEEGNLAPVELFSKRFPDFPYTMALQDALTAARRFDSIDIPRHFEESNFNEWASKIYHLTGKKESFVALQRTLSGLIASAQWNKALQRIDYFNLSFEDVCVDEVNELRSILERPSDNRLTPTSIVRPAYDLTHPVMHPDGKHLFFCRSIDGQSHIQVATPTAGKKGTVWRSTGDIVFSNIVNSGIVIFSLFDGGDKMLIGNNGDIMIAELQNNNTWIVTETLPEPVNSPTSTEFDAYMLPDGSGLLFASDRSGGMNLQPSYAFFHGDNAVASDIYFAPIVNGKWGKPINLGININSPYMECSPVISDDLKTLYFITDGHGLGFGDIYYATRDNIDDWTSWSKAVNYGKEVNSGKNEKSISLAANSNKLLMCSNNEGRYGCSYIPLYHTLNTDFTRVEICANEVGFSAEIVEVASRKSISHPVSINQQSPWTGLLHTNQSYLVYSHQNGVFIPALLFTPSKNAIIRPNALSVSELLDMADQNLPLTLNGILFIKNSSSLETCSTMELDNLADFLLRSKTVGAELSCHVDGNDDAACFKLSQERADRVKQELVARGIHPDRIATSPYGNSQTKKGKAKTSISLTLHRLE